MTKMFATGGDSSEDAAVPFMVFEVEVCTTEDDAAMPDVTVSSEPVPQLKLSIPGVSVCTDNVSDLIPTSLYYAIKPNSFPDIPSTPASSSTDADLTVSHLEGTTEDSVSLMQAADGEDIIIDSIPEISSITASSSMDINGTVCHLNSVAGETVSLIQAGGGKDISTDSIPEISSITASSSMDIDGTICHLNNTAGETVSFIAEDEMKLEQQQLFTLTDSSFTPPPIVNVINLASDTGIIKTLTNTELVKASVFSLPITTQEVAQEIVISNAPCVTIPSISRRDQVCLSSSSRNDISLCSTKTDIQEDSLSQIVDTLADSIIDPDLARAATDAVQTGTLTPLVKEELKSTIRYKRWVSGKEDIQMEPPRSCSPDKLDSDEEMKASIRRTRNKLAAQKCRTKRKDHMDKLENECERLQTLNENVQEEIDMLENEKLKLEQLMLSHDLQARDCNVRLLSGVEFGNDV